MEQKPPLTETDNGFEIQKSVLSLIGFNRYNFLQTLAKEDLSPEEAEQIEVYEKMQIQSPEQEQNEKEYLQRLRKEKAVPEKKFTKQELWTLFIKEFKIIHGREFVCNDEIIENIKPIMLYFLQDDDFFFCKNLSGLSKPSFDKGLLIIGNFGNGKTAAMMVFEKIFKEIKSISFKGYTTKEIVSMFESINPNDSTAITRAQFDQKTTKGRRYFDDVKTERHASNFGKMNLMKEILEERENKCLPPLYATKTHLTCNYKEGFEGDVQKGLDEFEEKYGSRLYDRLFKMFNIIEFKGKSFRR